jgi:hypothetical protein
MVMALPMVTPTVPVGPVVLVGPLGAVGPPPDPLVDAPAVDEITNSLDATRGERFPYSSSATTSNWVRVPGGGAGIEKENGAVSSRPSSTPDL